MSSSPPIESNMTGPRPAEKAPARWRDVAGWPLRARLVALMIGLLMMLGLVVGATAEIYLHKTLYEQLDTRLTDMNDRAQHGPGGGFRPEGNRMPPGAQVNEIVLRLSSGTTPEGGIITLSTGSDGYYANSFGQLPSSAVQQL